MKKIEFQDYPSTETPLNAENLNQMQTNIEDAYEPSFAQMFTNSRPVIPAGKTTLDLEGVWGSVYDISVGDFYCDAENARIIIPAGSAEYVEVYGAVAGHLQPSVKLEIYDENGNYVNFRTFHLTTYDGYKSEPIASQIFEIPDTSKGYYVQCSIAHYKNEEATLNSGFGYSGTWFCVKKLK